MTTITGIPAHALLVHAIVVLAPLVALLEILCAFWPAARRRLVWLVLGPRGAAPAAPPRYNTAAAVLLTPLTTAAGEWLYNQQTRPSDILRTHAERGAWMIYFSIGLLLVAIALAVMQWLEGRSDKRRTAATVILPTAAPAV